MRQQGTQARTPTRKDGRRLLAQPAQGAAAFLREDDQGDDDDIDDEAEHEHILELGRAYVLREGSDVTIVANGVEIREALAAADALAADGISAEVIDAFSVKPLDAATILESVAKTRCVVTAEEHSVIGGLGSAVCELLAGADPVCVECVAVRDRFGKSGEFEELLGYFNIDATAIVEAVKKVRERAGLC